MRERTRLEHSIAGVRTMERGLDDAATLIELGEAEKDEATIAEAESALAALRDEAAKRELETLLSGEADANDCFLEVHAGAGGQWHDNGDRFGREVLRLRRAQHQ